MLSAFKNFFVTFLIAALVFGAGAYFAAQFLTDTITGIFDAEASELDEILNPSQNPTPSVTEPVDPSAGTQTPAEELEGDSFNMLFIVTDYQPEMFRDYLPAGEALDKLEKEEKQTNILGASYRRPRACAVLLVRADKERGEFTLTSFPSNMSISTPSGNQPMAELYNLYGTDFILSEVSALTGLHIDHYLLLNVTELYQIVTELGGITMDIRRPLYYNGLVSTIVKPDEKDKDILPQLYQIGRTEVNGAGAVAIITNEEYPDDKVDYRNTLVTDFFHAFMTKLLTKSEAELSAFYDSICEKAWVETTFTTKDLVAQTALIYTFGSDKFKTTVLNYPGKFITATETDAARFEPNETAGLKLFKPYRPYEKSNTAS